MRVGVQEFSGSWRRLVLSVPGQCGDALTQVEWLQSGPLYIDLRQRPGLAGRIKATCLAEVSPDEALVLATQEGFAGEFVFAGEEGEWLREIDFHPPTPVRDRGLIDVHGDLLIERGIETDYIEHWQRTAETVPPAGWSARLRDGGAPAILVRHGNRFGYARGRSAALAGGRQLGEMIGGADANLTRALLDCEISLGTVTKDGWLIQRSSLPWRHGAMLLECGATFVGEELRIADVDEWGTPLRRSLRLQELHGRPAFERTEDAAAQQVIAERRSGPFRQVPIVDVSGLGCGDPLREAAVAKQLRFAASEIGFFHIIGHGIAPAVTQRLQDAAKQFFNLPLDRKLASYIGNSSNHRGYVPEGEEVFTTGQRDRKEAYDLALDLPAHEVTPGHPMLGPNQWPDLPGFREDVMAYYAAAFAVGRRLLGGFAVALGKPADSFDYLVTRPPSQLRLIHYPLQEDAENTPGIGAHTDYECFTLLLATGPGLEVMNEAGDWVDVPPVPGGLIVNIGDMMEYWSGGTFVATSHRVRKVAQERWSFPLFFALDYDVELRALDRPANQPGIRTGEHLYAQTVQTFRYLQERATRGDIAMPNTARPLSSFGQEARHAIHNPHMTAANQGN
jgi:isopenicillin N synthase-like dioxygenase